MSAGDLTELQRRAGDVAARQRDLHTKRTSLADQRSALARGNQLRRRITDFTAQVRQIIDQLDNVQKQQLLRLLVEEVKVTGWHVQIRLRIALDPPRPDPQHPGEPTDRTTPPTHTHPMSTEDRLRSVGGPQRRQLPPQNRDLGRVPTAATDEP